MMIFNITLILFGVAMIANTITLIRHWRMMRVMNITLNSLIETQQQYNELLEAERRGTTADYIAKIVARDGT